MDTEASQDGLNRAQWNADPFVIIVFSLEENDVLQQSSIYDTVYTATEADGVQCYHIQYVVGFGKNMKT
jgi:hypothetical protein